MKKDYRTKEQLLKEIEKLNERIASLEKGPVGHKNGEQELKNNPQFLNDVFDSIQDGISVLDTELNIIRANKWMEEKYADQMPLVGKKCYEVYQRRNSVCPWCPSKTTLEDGTLHTEIVPYPDADNPTGWIELSAYPFLDNSGKMKGVIEHVKDITERKKAEGRIEHLNFVLHAIRSVNQLIIKEGNRDALIQGVCEIMVKTRGYYYAWITLIDRDGKYLNVAEAGLGEDFNSMKKLLEAGELPECGMKALEQRELIITDDPLKLCKYCPLSEYSACQGTYTIPLEHDGVIYGLLSASIPEESVDDRKEQWLFREVAGDIAFALHDIVMQDMQIEAVLKLRVSEDKYRTIFENTGNSTVIIEKNSIISLANSTFEEFSGYSREEIEGKISWTEFVVAEDIERMKKQHVMRRENDGDVLKNYEFRFIDKNKNIKYVFLTIDMIQGTQKSVASLLDITERKQAENALYESEEKYRHLYENATLGIYRTTPGGDLIMANPSLVSMLGYSSFDKMVFNDIVNCVYSNQESREKFKEIIEREGVVHGYEDEWLKTDGSVIYIRESARVIRDANGTSLYYEGVVEDITEIKKAGKAIIEAKEKAEASNKMKSDFLAQMSHEIRTPLNTVLNFVGLIEESVRDKIDKEGMSNFTMIQSASKRIIRTIDLILNMSEVQTGTYEAISHTCDLYSDVILTLFNEMSASAKEKDLEFSICKKIENTKIIADEYSVGQIFSNLIDNAIKYTNNGKVEIIIIENNKGELTVSVSDTGIGIDEKYIHALFEPFSQEERGYSRKYDGTGLGLALVKKYCQVNNAEISVESEKGKGSVFTVTFKHIN